MVEAMDEPEAHADKSVTDEMTEAFEALGDTSVTDETDAFDALGEKQ